MGIQASLPRKAPKKDRPVRFGVHFWLTDGQGRVLLRTRPYKGLLGGMTELPGNRVAGVALDGGGGVDRRADGSWTGAGCGQVRHGFTHFELIIDVLASQVPVIEAEGFAHPLDALEEAALPSVMWKCVRMAGSGRV